MRTIAILVPLCAFGALGCAAARPATLRTTAIVASNVRAPSELPLPTAPDARACALAERIESGQTVRGTTTGRPDLFHATCAYGAASADAVYSFHLDAPSRVEVRVSSSYDSAVYIRSSCLNDDTEIACNDDLADERHAGVSTALPAGDYFVFIDGYESGHAGFYSLTYVAVAMPGGRPARSIERARLGEGVTSLPRDGSPGVSGTVTFAKREFTPNGLTRATQQRPAPAFVVEALDAHDTVIATTETDDAGAFRLPIASGQDARIRVVSRTTHLRNDIRVVSDAGTERPYELSTQRFRVAGGERFSFQADVGGVETAGAFNILAQFVRYLTHIDQAFHRPLPPLFAFWRRGNNRTLPQGNITAFLGEYHRHANTFALQIQGGDPAGREDASDSDQFDDPVILHEFSHFVVHTLAGHFSIGGIHQNGELHFPGQALDEGAATALGNAVLGQPRYWDTAGLAPAGQILVDENVENMTLPDRGIGSQNSAQVLLWDLMDGAENLPDEDHDGVAIGLSGALRIYASFHDDPVAFPGIHTIIERAVDLRLITAAQATRLTRTPTDHGFAYPLPAAQQWPVDLTLPAETTGLIDGRTQPAPSGGRNVPSNGFDSMRTYRLRIPRRGWLNVELGIEGGGTQQAGSDLDLWLTSRNLETVARATTQDPVERIHRVVEAGTYILIVRDADASSMAMRVGTQGNRSNFRLRVRLSESP